MNTKQTAMQQEKKENIAKISRKKTMTMSINHRKTSKTTVKMEPFNCVTLAKSGNSMWITLDNHTRQKLCRPR